MKKGDVIFEWDPFNAVIVSESDGKLEFENFEENLTYKVESDETDRSARKDRDQDQKIVQGSIGDGG